MIVVKRVNVWHLNRSGELCKVFCYLFSNTSQMPDFFLIFWLLGLENSLFLVLMAPITPRSRSRVPASNSPQGADVGRFNVGFLGNAHP